MDLSENLELISSELNIKSLKVLKVASDSSYAISKGDIDGDHIILKVISINDKERIFRAKKEKAITDLLYREIMLRSEPKYFALNKKMGQNKLFFWILREYIIGNPLGGVGSSYDSLTQEYLNESTSILNEVVNKIRIISSIEKKNIKQINLFRKKKIRDDG